MVREISKKEFEARFPDVDTYGLEQLMPVYLDNGVILTEYEWNGDVYTIGIREYKPVQVPDVTGEDGEVLQWKIIGYEER